MTTASRPSTADRARWAWRSVAVTVAAVVVVGGLPATALAGPVAAQDPTTSADPSPTVPPSTGPGPTSTGPDSASQDSPPPDTATPDGPPPAGSAAGELGASSPVHPDEPKLGVPLETLSADPRGAVVLDGAPVAYKLGAGLTNLVLIGLTDRSIASYDQYPVGLGFGEATQRAQSYAPKSYYAVLSVPDGSAQGIRVNDTDSLNAYARAVGAPELTADEQARVRAGAAVSILGVPGRAAGSGYTLVAPQGGGSAGANITGLLRWNPRPAVYSFVPATPRIIDTSSAETQSCDSADPTACTGLNTVAVDPAQTSATRGADTYPVRLAVGRPNGFQVLSLDSRTLVARSNVAVDTGTADGGSADLLSALRTALDAAPSGGIPPLVVVQSIGRPRAVPGWAQAGTLLESAGGTRQALMALDGTVAGASGDYTFVGSTRAGAAAVQASGKLGQQGPVTGILAPAHDMGYLPQVSTYDGPAAKGVNLDQVRIDHQAPQAFPAIAAGAEAALGRTVELPGCQQDAPRPTDGGPACSFRRQYVKGFDDDWARYWERLDRTPATNDAVPGYAAARTQLLLELDTMRTVRDFYLRLKTRMTEVAAGGSGSKDLRTAGDAIVSQVTQVASPPGGTIGFDAMKVVSAVMGVVGLIAPEARAIWGPISTMYGFASTIYGTYASQPGKPDNTLADAVRVQVRDLGEQAQLSIGNGQYAPVQEGQIVAGDWGKLQAVKTLIGGTWNLTVDDGTFAGAIDRGTRAAFYKAVIPATYPLLVRADTTSDRLFDPGAASRTTGTLRCARNAGSPRDPWIQYFHPWQNQPASASFSVPAYDAPGTPPMLTFPTVNGPVMDNPADDTNVKRNTIPDVVAEQAFRGTADSGVQLNLLEFLSPRYFGAPRTVNDLYYCGLY